MAVVDEIAVDLNKGLPPKKLEIEDETFDLNGPVKTPATSQYAVPQDSDFGSAEFMIDSGLSALGDHLIGTKANLAHLKGMAVHFRWKRKGGAFAGKCIKASGLVREYSEADFIVWLGADNCQGMTKHQVEALLFHELCHAGRDENGNRTILKHDMEEFVAVVREYGLVSPSIRAMNTAMKQMALDL